MALAIRLNDWEYLLAHDFIMLTKDGRPYRCGKSAYRINWDKLIGKTIKLHQHTEPYTLLDRFKGEDGKWYLKVTDGQFIYTETQDRCKYNKKWSKDVVIEDMPQEEPVEVPQFTYQLCLPAPMELIDRLVRETEAESNYLFNDYAIDRMFLLETDLEIFKAKLKYLRDETISDERYNTFYRRLAFEYHPDRNSNPLSASYFDLLYYVS